MLAKQFETSTPYVKKLVQALIYTALHPAFSKEICLTPGIFLELPKAKC
jgi:hypothetical protein